jgi:superfamily II DNA or RNA helicase
MTGSDAPADTSVLTLRFERGSLLVCTAHPGAGAALALPSACVWDDRVGQWRAPALAYRDVFADLYARSRKGEFTLHDEARAYVPVEFAFRSLKPARPYQAEAVATWKAAGQRGIVVLPTGSGKSHVAQLIMAQVGRSTLVVVPTLDLMHQWHAGLEEAFGPGVGLLGGGDHDLQAITVSTYDSAAIHMERYGARFGLLVFDEVHHLPGPTYMQAARMALAPFRLGLTATPERQDGREEILDEVVGPIVFRRDIRDFSGEYLADYDTEHVAVTLTDAEFAAYTAARETYTGFIRRHGIRFDGPNGWGQFLQRAAASQEGRRALRAWREQKRLSLTSENKMHVVESLIAQHANDRVIVFTADNDTVYAISRRLLLPVITHQTPTRERREILARFHSGVYRVVVTSKVLNEGVDVPEANVAIVLGGSGSVREHVQRLGRILRKSGDKRALLYEVVTRNTVEEFVSERRRDHDAYR